MKLRNKILAGVTAVFITTSGIALKINANTENTYYKYLPNSYAENYTDVTYIDTNLQRFVCNLCKNDDVITPALIYSIAWRESFYTSDLKKFCEDNSIDYGMMQINEKDFEWLQNQINIEINEKTMLYSYTNIRCGYEILQINMSYFREQGFIGDELIYALILSYDKGVTESYEMIKNNITDERANQIWNMYCFIENNDELLTN